MRKGIRVADPQINQLIAQVESDLDSTNCRTSGFTPFGTWQKCSQANLTLDAGTEYEESVQHGLGEIPTGFLVTHTTGDYQLWAVEPWSSTTARFRCFSVNGTRLKIVFWRDE